MSEQIAYQTFRKNIIRRGDRIHRIENLVSLGFPDVNFCIQNVEGWIEIKAPTEPKRSTTPLFGSNHRLSQSQMNWFLLQRNAGGIGYIYIETNERRILIDQIHADRINTMTISELISVASWHHLISNMGVPEWIQLRSILANPPRRPLQ